MTTGPTAPCSPPRADLDLSPGQAHFAREPLVLRTLLGSCVALTFWHPHKRYGGMCHWVVPDRRTGPASAAEDLRSAEGAVAFLVRQARALGTDPRSYQVKLFGGARQLAALSDMDAGGRNIGAARRLLSEQGLRPAAEHVGSSGARTVVLDLHTGDVWLRHTPGRTAPPAS